MGIKDQINAINNTLKGTSARLIAVSKTEPNEMILEAYHAGQRDFGENKVQDLVSKYEQLPKDIRWHMIGHLQRNKVKYIAPFVHLIHGIDSLKLLKEVNKEGAKNDRIINCLLQVHIAEEETKFGLSESELQEIILPDTLDQLPFVRIKGLMGMATNTDNETQVEKEFENLNKLFKSVQQNHDHSALDISELSMGMSGDYHLALKHGSTMIRIGSTIFGARNYQ